MRPGSATAGVAGPCQNPNQNSLMAANNRPAMAICASSIRLTAFARAVRISAMSAFRRELVAIGADRVAHHRHRRFGLVFVEAGVAKALRGGAGIEGRGVHVPIPCPHRVYAFRHPPTQSESGAAAISANARIRSGCRGFAAVHAARASGLDGSVDVFGLGGNRCRCCSAGRIRRDTAPSFTANAVPTFTLLHMPSCGAVDPVVRHGALRWFLIASRDITQRIRRAAPARGPGPPTDASETATASIDRDREHARRGSVRRPLR